MILLLAKKKREIKGRGINREGNMNLKTEAKYIVSYPEPEVEFEIPSHDILFHSSSDIT